MARNAKVLRVTLEALKCTRSSGDGVGGANLEVYGSLGAHGIYLDPNTGDPRSGFSRSLWEVDEDHSQNVAENTEIPVYSSVEFPVFQRDFLWIGGTIKEDDVSVDDTLARDNYAKFSYDNIIHNTSPTVLFSKDDQEIVARYKIEILRTDEHPELN
jgi:hypothetical protein